MARSRMGRRRSGRDLDEGGKRPPDVEYATSDGLLCRLLAACHGHEQVWEA